VNGPDKEQGSDHPSGTGLWPIGDTQKEEIGVNLTLDIPKGSLPLPGGKTITLPGSGESAPRSPGTRLPGRTNEASKISPPKQSVDGQASADTELRPEPEKGTEPAQRDPDAPPLGDDYGSEALEAGGWSDPMRNEPKDEDEEESSNTALWVGLGAVGVGALIWWASAKK